MYTYIAYIHTHVFEYIGDYHVVHIDLLQTCFFPRRVVWGNFSPATGGLPGSTGRHLGMVSGIEFATLYL